MIPRADQTKHYEEGLDGNMKLIKEHTIAVYEPLWWRNIAINLDACRKGGNVKSFANIAAGRPVIIIGNGPSVHDGSQLAYIKDHRRDNLVVIACDAAFKRCLQYGVVPDFVTTMDATESTSHFFKGLKRVPEFKHVKAIASIISNPGTVKTMQRLFKQVYWYLPIWDQWADSSKMSITRGLHYATGKAMLDTLGNVGGFSWFLAGYMGAATRAIAGLDYGYPADTPLEKTQYYEAYQGLVEEHNKTRLEMAEQMKKHNPEYEPVGDPLTIEGCYRILTNPDTGADVLVGLNWDAYRRIFLDAQEQLQKILKDMDIPDIETVNVSPVSSLWGPHIRTMTLKKWMEVYVK